MGSVVYRYCLPVPSPHGSPASPQAHTHTPSCQPVTDIRRCHQETGGG